MTSPPEFPCRGCGNCCRATGYVRLLPEEPARIAQYLGMPPDRFLDQYTRLTQDRRALALNETSTGACIFLTAASRCAIQNVKPRQCRDYPSRWHSAELMAACRGFSDASRVVARRLAPEE